MIQLRALEYQVKTPSQILIESVSFELSPGQRLVIFGENGSGKSTFIQDLLKSAFQTTPGLEWSGPSQSLHYMPQTNPFTNSSGDSVTDYLKKTLRVAGLTAQDSEINAILARLRLKDKWISHLSGGERQKLKLAQGLLLKSELLLLDEPLNGVDTSSKFEILNALNEILPKTLQIFVIHDLLDIRKLNCPVLVIENKKAHLLSSQEWFKKIDSQFHASVMCHQHEATWN
jgi:ABC-type Mn2+/Zn2+ transport system ATPase subunit